MRIAQITGSFLPVVGGLEWKVHYLATEYRRRGHDVVVFCTPPAREDDGPMPIVPDYEVIRTGPPPWKGMGKLGITNLCVSRRVLREHRRRSFDVLHCHNLVQPTHQGLMVKRRTGLPVVATTCGGDIMLAPEIGFGVRLDPYYDRMVRENLRRVDLVGCVSGAIHREVESLQPDARLVDLPNGVDWESFQIGPSDYLRRRLKLPAEALIVVSVGAHRPAKDYPSGVRAFAKIAAASPRAHYVLVGRDMGGLAEMTALIAALGLGDRVHLVDQVPMSDVPLVLRSADIFLSSSLTEGFPQVAAQALAAALPGVLTDCSGNEDLRSCPGVLMVRRGDPDAIAGALARLVDDVSLRTRMGAAAHDDSRRFAWSTIAQEYLKIFESLPRRGARGSGAA